MEWKIRITKSSIVGIKMRNTSVVSSRWLVGVGFEKPHGEIFERIMSVTSKITCEFFQKQNKTKQKTSCLVSKQMQGLLEQTSNQQSATALS